MIEREGRTAWRPYVREESIHLLLLPRVHRHVAAPAVAPEGSTAPPGAPEGSTAGRNPLGGENANLSLALSSMDIHWPLPLEGIS